MVSADKLAKAPGAHQAFVLDAWLANWDVVGATNDNMMVGKDGSAVRIDVGGSLVYRAMGGAKGDDFGDTVPELETLKDHSKNGKAAAVFGSATDDSIKWGAGQLALIKPEQIAELCKLIGPGDDNAKTALSAKLIARRAYILSKMGVHDPWNKPPVDKSSISIDITLLPNPKSYFDGNGKAVGPSSHDHVNKTNASDSAAMLKFAQGGNLAALEAYEFDSIDKATGAPTGKKPINQHSSSHVKQYHTDLVEALMAAAHPFVEGVQMPHIDGGGSVEEVNAAAGYFSPGENINTIAPEKILGFWMRLAHVGAEAVGELKPKTHSFIDGDAEYSKGQKWWGKIASSTKAILNKIMDSQAGNRYWNNGVKTLNFKASTGDSYKGGAQSLASQCYADAVEHDEGTVVGKWMTMPKAMQQQFFKEGPGLVFQNADSMCCSVKKNWSHHSLFGDGSAFLNIRYAKGAKALDSFGSGRFKQSEREVTALMGARFVVLEVKKGNSSDTNGITLDLLMLPPNLGYVAELEQMKALGKSIVLFVAGIFRKAIHG